MKWVAPVRRIAKIEKVSRQNEKVPASGDLLYTDWD
jgi:hypothetical protein